MIQKSIMLVAFFCVILSGISAAPIYPPRLKDGEVTLQSVLSLYVDAITTRFCSVTASAVWSESAKGYTGLTWNHTSNEGEALWQSLAQIIAFDGTDAQVARTGLTRDELIRRVSIAPEDYINLLYKHPTRAQYLAMVQTANQIWASGVTDTIPNLLKRPDSARIFMGFNQDHDYGDGPQHFTCPSVPQDFADPRMVAGKSIKEWSRQYKIASSLTSGRDSNGLAVVNPYSPDFAGDHHNVLTDLYPLGSIFTHAGPPFIGSLIKGKAPLLNERTPLNHKQDQAMLVMRHTSNLGFYNAPAPYYIPSVSEIQLATAYAAYGQKEALGFLARGLESHARGLQKGVKVDWALDRLFVWGYFVLRFTGVDLGPCPAYKEASKIAHGSYWYKYYRYGIHRTPDKMVLAGWNGTSRNRNATVELSELDPKLDAVFATGTALVGHSGLSEMPRCIDFLTTQIIPDNDDFLPDSENYLMRSTGNMQGTIDGKYSLYIQSYVDARENRSDGVFSTAGDISRRGGYNSNSQIDYARQYQSLTSFYNKMCISMVQIKPGKDRQGALWMGGFSVSFSTNQASPVSSRTCYYDSGSFDLNTYAVPSIAAYGQEYYTNPGVYKNLTGSKWWSVNGRLGIAVLGGDQGYFKAYPAWSSGTARGGLFDPAAMIGYEAPLGTADAKGNQLDMAAAYITDTPPEKVKAIQTSMKSIDDQLPVGWKGVTSSTPEDQRVLALARFYPTSAETADIKLNFPEGAPVLECATTIVGDTAKGMFVFDTLESWGQTMAFYVSAATGSVIAEQIGDITMRIKGTGTVLLKYLSKAVDNTIYIDGAASSRTKQELAAGITLTLTQDWTDVRITNAVDDDHSGPAVEVVSPEYVTQYNTRALLGVGFWNPKKTVVDDGGLNVNVRARDRSGVAYVKIYLDWVLVDSLTQAPYEITIPKERFLADSIHAIHAIACDKLGNLEESFSVPFQVLITGDGTGIEPGPGRGNGSSPVNAASLTARQGMDNSVIKPALFAKAAKASTVAGLVSADSWTAHGRVQPKKGFSADASAIRFSHNNIEYVFGLDANMGKAVLSRRNALNEPTLVGEAVVKVKAGAWYDLKVVFSGGKMVGYINGQEKVVVTEH